MATKKKTRRPAKMGSLQEAVETGLAALPHTFLEKQISKKLKDQMGTPPEGLARQLAEHLLSGSTEPFHAEGVGDDVDVHITIDESDMKEIEAGILRFQQEALPELLRSMSEDTAERTLRSLKTSWPNEQQMQESDIAGFRERMQHRWEKPLGQLRMLLTMVREWCGEVRGCYETHKSTRCWNFSMITEERPTYRYRSNHLALYWHIRPPLEGRRSLRINALCVSDWLPKLDTISLSVGDPAKLSEIVAFAFWIDRVAFVYQTENSNSTPRISSEKRASRARSPDMAQS
jgi:hypothetical protein